MRGDSRHGSSRPDRTRGRARTPAAAPRESRPGVTPADLVAVLEPVAAAAGMDLESVKIAAAGRRRLLRVVVDADGGVGLDEIAEISRDLSARLDATGAMGEAPYTLEVSSPGVDRPLTLPRHWRRAVGRLVRAPLAGTEQPGPGTAAGPAGQAGRAGHAAAVEGRVLAAGPDGVTLEIGGQHREFGYAELGPGRVQVEFGRLDAGPAIQDAAAAAAGPRTRGRSDGH
jgi:ribosome maturation factor RimP